MRYATSRRPAPRRARQGASRWLRRLAAPATGLVAVSLFATAAPAAPAHAASSGTLQLKPSSGAFVALETSRLSSKTVVDLKVPTSLPFSSAIQLRSATNAAGYRAKVRVAANGAVTVSLSRVAGGSETALGTPQATGVTARAGESIRLQGAIAGLQPVQAYVRAWKAGSAAPDWQLAAKDYTASRITTEGQTRLWGYLSGTASAASTLAFSNKLTDATTVDVVKTYPVKQWVTAGTPPTTSGTTEPAPAPAPAPALSTGKPSSTTTGVKAGSTLKQHYGDITVTKDGTVLSNLDIHGFVTVRAKNVTITNSIVRGGKAKGVATGLISNYGYAGLVISDVRVVPEFPSVWFDGIKGSDFTARRVHVSGGVDSVKIHGSNVTIENSLLENTTYFSSDPQQGGGPTHNDNVQILYGANLRLVGNTIRGSQNFAVLGGATRGNTNLVLKDNWLDGGHCTVKLQILNGWSETAVVTGNKFGPNRKVSSCAFTSYPAVKLTHGSNTFEATGKVVSPLILVS